MKTLLDLYNKHKKGDWPDKGSVHSYIEVYEEILAPYRHSAKNVLEIGLMNGESLRMWEEYFNGKVWGMDCSETPINGKADLRPMIAEGTHNIVICDAENSNAIETFFKGIKFDVIIEDAGHDIVQQLKIYDVFESYMANDSIYIIEDIQFIDTFGHLFSSRNFPQKKVTIIDRRYTKQRYDDVLVVIKDKE